jgi:hypothetical protein
MIAKIEKKLGLLSVDATVIQINGHKIAGRQ